MLRPSVHRSAPHASTLQAAAGTAPRTYDEMLAAREAHASARRALQRVAERAQSSRATDSEGGVDGRLGCFGGLVRRLRAGSQRLGSAASTGDEASSPASASSRLGVLGGLFAALAAGARGLMRSRSERSAARLDEAEGRLAQRVTELEERVALARDEAKLRMQAKQKPAALRALKRAKALEHSLAQANAARVAVERQRDLLEEAKLQHAVTGAIGTSMASLKKTCGSTSLASAEQAIDDAAEAHDQLQEIHDAMGQFGASAAASAGADDDDELMAELEQMLEVGEPTQSGAKLPGATDVDDLPGERPAFPSAPVDEALSQAQATAKGAMRRRVGTSLLRGGRGQAYAALDEEEDARGGYAPRQSAALPAHDADL